MDNNENNQGRKAGKKLSRAYFHCGLTAFLTVCALLIFYDTVFRRGVLLSFLGTLTKALKPVIYGAAMAYLLAPAVNSFDELIRRLSKGRGRPGLIRAGSILLTWLLVGVILYCLFSLLIPQVYQSVVTLVANSKTYYNTVYTWVRQLLDRNPQIAALVSSAVDEYWDELRKWFTGTFLPQAQQTIGVLTSGVLSVLLFFKDFLVGVVVSIYLLALKERFAKNTKRLIYSLVYDPDSDRGERIYRTVMAAMHKVDEIFSGFVRGKLIDSIIIGVLCFIGTAILAIPYAPLISVVVGATNIIPFFGPFLGAIPSALLILLVSPVKCLYFIIFVLVLQQLDGNVIGPKILSGPTDLPSFWVIVAILIGGGFFNVLGMFLGVPVFACFYAFINHFVNKRLAGKSLPAPTAQPPARGDSRAEKTNDQGEKK